MFVHQLCTNLQPHLRARKKNILPITNDRLGFSKARGGMFSAAEEKNGPHGRSCPFLIKIAADAGSWFILLSRRPLVCNCWRRGRGGGEGCVAPSFVRLIRCAHQEDGVVLLRQESIADFGTPGCTRLKIHRDV